MKRRTAARPSAKPKARKKRGGRSFLVQRVATSARRRRQTEVVAMLCEVTEAAAEAEMLLLQGPVRGERFALPLASKERDGALVKGLAGLVGKRVWLSVRLA